VRRASQTALADRLSEYAAVVEIGVGRRPDLAAALAASGTTVTATDVEPRETPPEVRFVRDDVTDPTVSVYADAEALVARNLPPELQRPTAELADRVDADFLFTTLGGDPATVPVRRETLAGETLFVYRNRP
jgi:uncharacterized UPF0146 family protein